jgi:hypothetical protein
VAVATLGFFNAITQVRNASVQSRNLIRPFLHTSPIAEAAANSIEKDQQVRARSWWRMGWPIRQITGVGFVPSALRCRDEVVHEASERFPVGEFMITLATCRAMAPEDNMANDLFLEIVVLIKVERARGQMRGSRPPARGLQQMVHI